VSEAYERYFEATSKITLNKDNLEDHLFSYVSYQYCENQGTGNPVAEEIKAKPMKSGVFLRAKYDA
jgi:hypothetical protein